MKKTIKEVSREPLIGVYAGTFDPTTLGHLDIIERALNLVDHLIVAVADNPGKNPLFNTQERIQMMETDLANNKKITGKSFEVMRLSELLVDFVAKQNAKVIVRGLRAISDFEFEFQMTGMNRSLNKDIETMFLFSQDKFQFISSSFVKEVARLKGDVSPFITPPTLKALMAKYGR